jgi:hypothetical protein
MSLASAIVAVGWTPTIASQQGPLPATPAPRELAMLAEVKPPRQVASPTVDAILEVAHLTRADIERRKSTAAFSKPYPAVPHPPPEFQEVREIDSRAKQPDAALISPSVRELIEIIRRRRGGAQLLERARRDGARIIPPSSTRGYFSFTSAQDRGGLRSPTNTPEFDLIAAAQTPLSTKVTRNAPSASVTGLGTLWAQAYYPMFASADLNVWGPLERNTWTHSPVGGTYAAKSYVMIWVNVETAGWYLINVVANQKVRAEMRRYSGSPSSGYPLIQTFTAPPTVGYNSYPVLVNLAAGGQYFSWVNLDRFCFVSEVSVTKF